MTRQNALSVLRLERVVQKMFRPNAAARRNRVEPAPTGCARHCPARAVSLHRRIRLITDTNATFIPGFLSLVCAGSLGNQPAGQPLGALFGKRSALEAWGAGAFALDRIRISRVDRSPAPQSACNFQSHEECATMRFAPATDCPAECV